MHAHARTVLLDSSESEMEFIVTRGTDAQQKETECLVWRDGLWDAGAIYQWTESDPTKGHVVDKRGDHCLTVISIEQILKNPTFLDAMAEALVSHAESTTLISLESVDVVVGRANRSITTAHALAQCISPARNLNPCLRAYVERREVDRSLGEHELLFMETTIPRGSQVLLCETVLTPSTVKDIVRMCDTVEAVGGVLLPYVFALANQTEETFIRGLEVVTLVKLPMKCFSETACPACKAGSKAWTLSNQVDWTRLTKV